MRMGPEYYVQKAVYDWVILATDLPVFHIPSEGLRSPQFGKALKNIGWIPGLPDLVFPRPTESYAGLVIELKTGKNKPSPAQISVIDMFLREGWQAKFIWEAQPAIDFIKSHYGL